jgi:DNA-binding NtrC family response regulator
MAAIGRFTPPEAESQDNPSKPLSAEMAAFASLAGSSNHPVLIGGETGCGKTHLARLIHAAGPRRGKPFVRVNCASIPEALFEREMFGHVRGAYTDARGDADGFLAAADGGTLFLDEIGELSLQTQPKLLAVLEDGCFRKLGSPREVRVDVRVVTATNRDLGEMLHQRGFREDLYYRLSVLRFTVPPLRERRGEIPALVEEILRRAAPRLVSEVSVTDDALRLLLEYPWPGNIRELENVLRAAVVFSEGRPIEPRHLSSELRAPRRGQADSLLVPTTQRYEAPADARDEARTIQAALDAVRGNKTLAAKRLGMSRSTLWAKLQRYNLEP